MEEVTRVSMDAFQLTGTRDEAGLLINSLRSLSVCAYKTLVIIISFPSLTSHRHPAPANYFFFFIAFYTTAPRARRFTIHILLSMNSKGLM